MWKIFLDLETTGLNPKNNDRIIEIACLKLSNNYENMFHYYLNPKVKIKLEAYKIHKITNSFLKDKPMFKDIVFEFLEYISNSILIIHNASFDLKFLNFELKKIGFKTLDNYCFKIIDTLKISKKLYKNKRNSLDHLCKRFNINCSFRKKRHSALIDVKVLKLVYLNLKKFTNKLRFLNNKNLKKKKYTKNNILIKLSNVDKFLNNYYFLNYL